jgi:hypothetical protein
MPARVLKPGITGSENIDRLTQGGEILFYRLLTVVDDYGRADARPAMIRAHCYPIKEGVTTADCAAWLADLEVNGLVQTYAVDGKPYLQMLRWGNTPRALTSKFPPPPAPASICKQTHADAQHAHADSTVTVTETETETEKKAAPRKRSASSSAFKAEDADIPAWLDRALWQAWCKDRRTRGKPVTQAAAVLQHRQLAEYMAQGHKPRAVIEHSIAGGFQGLYPPKGKPNGPGQAASVHPDDWRETRSGIEGKGESLGLGKWDQAAFERGLGGETFQQYRQRVEQAAQQQEVEA